MKKFRKFLVLALAGMLTAAMLASCGLLFSFVESPEPPEVDTQVFSTPFASRPGILTVPDLSARTTPADGEPLNTTPEPLSTTQAPVTTAPPPSEPEYPTFDNLTDLGDYLDECRDNGELDPIFTYTGDHDEVWNENYSDLLCMLYTSINYYGNSRNTYRIQLTEYPGDRMLDAYRSGDRSALSDEEKEALDIAEAVVADAQKQSDSDLELEILLHDWICDNAVYSRAAIYIPDPSKPPHHLTAVGALLDGSVNCQGYTDAFYLLASMAGFTVDRQFGTTSIGAHIFNTIELDGEWYIVDVTHDDTSLDGSGNGPFDYRFLNVGRDVCEHEWEEAYEHHAISDDSSDDYYYYYSYDLTFDEVDEVAQTIVSRWKEDGQTEFYLMLKGQNAGWETLNPILSDYLNQTGRAYNYTTWHSFQGENTYYYVVFE